jgi:hypothetical protein
MFLKKKHLLLSKPKLQISSLPNFFSQSCVVPALGPSIFVSALPKIHVLFDWPFVSKIQRVSLPCKVTCTWTEVWLSITAYIFVAFCVLSVGKLYCNLQGSYITRVFSYEQLKAKIGLTACYQNVVGVSATKVERYVLFWKGSKWESIGTHFHLSLEI